MTPVDIDACRKLCEPSTNVDLASHEHFLMLQRNLRRALDEIAELRGEVERLGKLAMERYEEAEELHELLGDKAIQRSPHTFHTVRAERDSLRAEVERLRETGGTALNDAYVRARDERDEYKRALRLVRLERDQFNREAIDLRAQLATVTRERDEARERLDKSVHIDDAVARALTESVREADIEHDTAEAIAAWLESKSKEYKRKQNAAFSTDAALEDEYGWAWSYTDGHAADIRAGHWRPTGDKR